MDATNNDGRPPPNPDVKNFAVSAVTNDTAVVLQVAGELDMLTAPTLDSRVDEALKSSRSCSSST